MKKLTLSAITVALLIGSFYAFVFFTTDNIDSEVIQVAEISETVPPELLSKDDEETEFSEVQFINDNTEEDNELSSDDTSIENYSQMYLAPNKNTATGTDVPYVKPNAQTSTTTATAVIPVTTTAPVTTTVATTTTPVTTTLITTTTVTTTPATTTTPITTESVTSTTGAEIIPSGDFSEDLTVKVYGSTYKGNGYELICRIVAAEMGPTFNVEAIKAQAVATYSYIKYSNARGIYPSVNLSSNVTSKISEAVKSVYGVAVYYNGSIAQTVYSASSGGSTASARDVWGNNVPYLVSVQNDYDEYDSNYGSTKIYSESQVRSILSSAGFMLSNSPENWFTLLPAEQGGVFDGGYVGNMLIDGNSKYNGKTITGRVLRESIFSFGLKSSKFTVEYKDGNFIFTTYGYGHGVGMSQNGANLYASKGGYSYIQILNHYYTGVTIK